MAAGHKALVGIVGTAAAAVLISFVPLKESGPNGPKLKPYVDPVGIVTVCDGITKNVQNRMYTKEECAALLAEELAEHAAGALKCVTPPLTVGQRAAYTSLAYNIGVNAFCGSTVVKLHNIGNYRGACAAISAWDKGMVGGKLTALPGLVIRRAEERAMCEKGLK